jgi:4-hydroxybenzoate polyprenyltransferase
LTRQPSEVFTDELVHAGTHRLSSPARLLHDVIINKQRDIHIHTLRAHLSFVNGRLVFRILKYVGCLYNTHFRVPMPVAAKLIQHRPHSMSRRSGAQAYLQLARPANVVTAAADILAGSAAAGAWTPVLALLVPAGMCLYGGGVVFNDIFDRHLDAVERPERPLPSGRASLRGAILLGTLLLLAGIVLAFTASRTSGLIAVAITASALTYDRFGKHHRLAGPVNMGLCRGLNLLLGISAATLVPAELYVLPIVPLVYIAAITALSAGEVHGGSRATVLTALTGVCAVMLAVPLLAALSSGTASLWALPFMGLLAFRVLRPMWRAYRNPEPRLIFTAVKAGVLSLIVLNSAIAAAWMGPLHGVAILALMPVAGLLSRVFAVT